jgi:hypothetical protein
MEVVQRRTLVRAVREARGRWWSSSAEGASQGILIARLRAQPRRPGLHNLHVSTYLYMEMFLKEHFWFASPLLSVRLFAALLLLHLCPGILQRYCAVEDGGAGLGVGIGAKISQALELAAASCSGVRQ